MIAYLDAEYNSNRSRSGETDMSVIEIAFAVCPNEKSRETVCQYHAFVKPIKNDGVLYRHISKLTGIKQEDVDNGSDYPDVVRRINELLKKYEVTKIYTWGGSDKPTLKWNSRQYKDLYKRDELFLRRMMDISEKVSKKIGSDTVLSLKNMAMLCGCDHRAHHNAMDDTLTLRDVACSVANNHYDRANLNKLKKYREQKRAYAEMKRAMGMVEKSGANMEEYIEMIKRGQSFPPFK